MKRNDRRQQPWTLPAPGTGWVRIAPAGQATERTFDNRTTQLLASSLRIRHDDPAPPVPATLDDLTR